MYTINSLAYIGKVYAGTDGVGAVMLLLVPPPLVPQLLHAVQEVGWRKKLKDRKGREEYSQKLSLLLIHSYSVFSIAVHIYGLEN